MILKKYCIIVYTRFGNSQRQFLPSGVKVRGGSWWWWWSGCGWSSAGPPSSSPPATSSSSAATSWTLTRSSRASLVSNQNHSVSTVYCIAYICIIVCIFPTVYFNCLQICILLSWVLYIFTFHPLLSATWLTCAFHCNYSSVVQC